MYGKKRYEPPILGGRVRKPLPKGFVKSLEKNSQRNLSIRGEKGIKKGNDRVKNQP